MLLSQSETRDLAESYTKSFGQRGAARKLTERGYKSPTGKPISQGHIYKILNGEEICFHEPEATPEAKPIEEPTHEWQPKPILGQSIADDFNAFTPEERQKIAENNALAEQKRQELLEEIEEEEAEEEEKLHQSKKHLQKVPKPSDYTRKEHPKPLQNARVNAVFNRRGLVEFETDEAGEEKLYYGIPKLRKTQPLTTCRPHEKHSFGQNSISTR